MKTLKEITAAIAAQEEYIKCQKIGHDMYYTSADYAQDQAFLADLLARKDQIEQAQAKKVKKN